VYHQAISMPPSVPSLNSYSKMLLVSIISFPHTKGQTVFASHLYLGAKGMHSNY
jgi:hypothetical protein